MKNDPTDWHRLFGLILTDFFTDSPFSVEIEKELALKEQSLDVLVLRRGPGLFAGRLPDGLDNLSAHNLITFKSHHEPLDDWALKELTGHYVNYRKQWTPWREPKLPETEFQLYGVCSRFPQNLANQLKLETVQQGVYECQRGTDRFRIIVAGQMPQEPHNAILHLFSAGIDHYEQRSHDASALMRRLFGNYKGEGIAMSYTMDDFRRDDAKKNFKLLTPEERREALRSLAPEERRKFIQGLPPEELLACVSPEQIAEHLKKLQPKRPSRKGKPRRKGRAD
jgi:hypothetical protein